MRKSPAPDKRHITFLYLFAKINVRKHQLQPRKILRLLHIIPTWPEKQVRGSNGNKNSNYTHNFYPLLTNKKESKQEKDKKQRSGYVININYVGLHMDESTMLTNSK